MLTRLRASGFKNLVDVDVRFGPFTCIAGANGVGKSNLFDAIAFLGDLAEHTLEDAAKRVRDDGSHTGDIGAIFHRVGDDQEKIMSFKAEMIIPRTGVDDLGQTAEATSTFLEYSLELRYRADHEPRSSGAIEILREDLASISHDDPQKQLGFPGEQSWLHTAIIGERRVPYFYVSTMVEDDARIIKVRRDGRSRGKSVERQAATLPRTVISRISAADSPTATLVKREMQAWRRLQLEPSALRRPDLLTEPTTLGSDGSHLPATLFNLAQKRYLQDTNGGGTKVYGFVAARLSQLIDDVRRVDVEKDDTRELLTLRVGGRDGTMHRARALSDGTLRFLALAVLELDPEFNGLLCLEEPENGIHPARIPAILRLLQDVATDATEPIGPDNPLRQVIVNTHSPAVVAQVPEDSLLSAETVRVQRDKKLFDKVTFSSLANTWRTRIPGTNVLSKGDLIAYLSSVVLKADEDWIETTSEHPSRRVIDNQDIQLALFGARK